MRWVLGLGWLLVAGILQAEVSMDLSSPFGQTALIQEKTGELSEKAVRGGKINGEVIELQKEEGGLLVVPRNQVVALLPRLPSRGTAYLQSDVQKAVRILEEAQTRFPQRSEVSPKVMEEWQKLRFAKTEHDELRSAALNSWLEKTSRLSSDTTPEELEKIKKEGAIFLSQFPDRSKEIERELRGLTELGGIDLKKVEAIQIEPGPLGENFIPGAVLWALLIIPSVVIVKAFSGALKGFREGAPLAGGVRLLVGGAALALMLGLFLSPQVKKAEPIAQEKPSSAAARKAGWFSLNYQEKWSNQGAKKIPLPASDWLAFLEERYHAGTGADYFPYWYLTKPRLLLTDSSFVFLQPVQAKIIILLFRFEFFNPKTGQMITDLELEGATVGKIPLGKALGQFIWNVFQPSYQPLMEKWGLTQGVRWFAGEKGSVVIEVPETKKPAPQAKESLPASELAQIFDQGYGEIYENKVITVEGSLVDISSEQETMGAGTNLAVQDRMDEFILEGIPEGPGRKYALRIRCQIKSPESYFLDAKGDLFKSAPTAQDPSSDIPILRRRDGVTKIRVSAGRVESKPTETRLITLYDCRKVEGFDGKEWVPIWGN